MADIGVYCITNKLNGKAYIGQSWNIHNRLRDYKTYCSRSNSHLRSAFNKYGMENFYFGVVELFPDDVSQSILDAAEDEYIMAGNRMNPIFGYNMRRGGSHGKHGEELRRLIAQIQTGRKLSDEHKRKIGEKSKGRYYSPETREKIGAGHRGLKMSAEVRRRLSEAHIGKKQNPESIAKMLKWRRENYKMSEETKKKISESNRGKHKGTSWNKGMKGIPWSKARRAAQEARRIA